MWRPRLRALGLGLLHALLFALAFPPVGWWWTAFLAPVPLLALAARPGRSPVASGFWAMLGVVPFWAYTHGWIANVSMAGVYPLVVYLSLFAWLFVVLGARACRVPGVPAAVGLAVVWVGLEFVRGRIAWSGYPWYLAGHPIIDAPGLAWPASVGGVSLVSLLVVLPGAWLVTAARGPRWVGPAIAAIVAVWVAGGLWWDRRPLPADAVAVRVGIVQTNVPQDNRMDWSVVQRLIDWQRMRDQTVQVATGPETPDVVVLPEGLVPGWTMDPASLAHERDRGIVWRLEPETAQEAAGIAAYGDLVPATQIVDELLAMQRSLGVPMLVGSVAFDNLRIVNGPGGIEYDSDAMYNSAFLVRNGRVADVWYDKLHLTPFGEIMPYISAWPWLEERLLALGAQGMTFALTPGRSPRTIPLELQDGGSVELVTPICFEATMPAVCRRLANRAAATGRPVVLVNITNDGWFGGSDRGRLMHELSARWRCVELGVPMVRCANTGVSGLIDAQGRSRTRLTPRAAATGLVVADAARPQTVFARLGEWPGWLAMLGVVPLVWMGRTRRSREPADAGS